MASILITGAGRGLGHAMAAHALALGHEVLGSVRSRADADRLVKELGPKVRPIVFDVTDEAATAAAIAAIEGPLDILINNAGVLGEPAGALAATTEELERLFLVNAVVPLRIARSALPALSRSDRPAILSVSTQMSAMSSAASDHIAYRASKVALNKMMQGLATELSSRRIPVLLVDPGWVRTDMGGPSADLDPADVAAGIIDLALSADLAMSGRFWMWHGRERGF